MPLHLFPAGLDSTLLVPVLVGVLVMAMLTEWWGWDFVGLVVPGYLCSVLILQPWVAAVVLVEAILTHGMVKVLDVGSTRAGLAFPVFGRDRFFLVLAVSIAVRVGLEGWGLQWLAELAQPRWPEIAAHRGELFGLGVVLVPLTANRLWRSGVAAGLFQLGTQTAVVWLLVSLLAVATNFSIAGFGLAYDHLALSFVSSPRDQILLILTAGLASALNRRYGWDFHGILVPALLALAFHSPFKLVATVLEAVVIVLVARQLLTLPALRATSVEGPRKVVLCFVVGFGLKMVLATFLSHWYPGFRPSDFFGLGYILPSLLAERIWLKGNLPLVLLPTVQTSLLGVAGGAALVLLLMRVAPPAQRATDAAAERYASLTQAVAALRPVVNKGGETDLTTPIDRAFQATFAGRTDDGYGLVFDEARPGLVAFPLGAAPGTDGQLLVMVCEPSRAEAAAAFAAERRWALVIADGPAVSEAARRLGTLMPCGSSPQGGSESGPLPTSARAAVLGPLAPASPRPAEVTPAPPRVIEEAAYRIHAGRSDATALAADLQPLGLSVHSTAGGLLVLQGQGWPQVLLRPNAAGVVASPHATELDAAAAALFAAEQLDADCVLPGGGPDGEVGLLAVALAEPRRRPLLFVRGTEQLPDDAVLLLQPEQQGTPAWLARLIDTLEPRLTVGRQLPDSLAALRAMPPRAGLAGPAALLWLSASARRALAGGASDFDRPDLLALATERGVPVLRDDVVTWLSLGSGAPAADLVATAERLARTRDVALLRRPAHGRLAVIVDAEHGLSGLAVESSGRRAVALFGERRQGSASVDSASGASRAIASGVRLLLAGGGGR